MTLSRVDDLWTRFLAEGALPAAEEGELLRALQADEPLRRRLLGDKQLDGLLDAVHSTEEDAPEFIRSFQDRISLEGDDSRFVARVEEKIKKPARPRRGAAGPRPPASPWMLVLTAAGIIAAIALSLVVLSPAAPVPVSRTPEAPRRPERAPAPVVPAPERTPEPTPPVVEAPRPPERKDAEARPPAPPPPAPQPEEKPAPAPVPEVKPAPAVPEPTERKTIPEPRVTERAVAKLDRVEGEVLECVDGERRPVQSGHDLAAGRGIETGALKSSAVVVYPDGTRLELAPETRALEFQDAAKGKNLVLEKGSLAADVPKQPAGRPLIVKTPQAEIRVLGTTFRLTIESGSTRLDVTTGKVRMTRVMDGKSVDVASGQFAVAAAGMELVAKSSAPKPRPVLLQENFQDPRGVDARWKIVGTANAVKTAGQLEIDLGSKPPSPNGWGGAGLVSRQAFALPLALSTDVDLPVLHGSVVAALVFIPQGKQRGAEGVFRIQLRENRYSLTTESGEARDLAGADRTGGAPCRERWRIEIDGAAVRFLVNDREIFRHKHEVQQAYTVGIDGSARFDAPSGARAGFDNVVIEPLK